MPGLQTLMRGLTFPPEQPRWHDDRLWFSDWGTRAPAPGAGWP
jgi:hypothetical protein